MERKESLPPSFLPVHHLFVDRIERIQFSEALAVEGAVAFARACELGLEGIVSKRAGWFNKSRISHSWLKTINPGFIRT